MSERSDGAYTSAFASWANGWRALQWQERQRVVETEMSAYQKGCLTELKTQFNRLREKHGNGHIKLYYITPAVPNLPLLNVRETAEVPLRRQQSCTYCIYGLLQWMLFNTINYIKVDIVPIFLIFIQSFILIWFTISSVYLLLLSNSMSCFIYDFCLNNCLSLDF